MEGAAGLGLGSAPVVGQFAVELSPLRADWGENLRRAARAGVPILVGSDSPLPADLPGSSLHAELQWLVEQGLSPAEALRGATSAAARLYDETDRGVIAAGKVADLLLVEGDPLTDIGATAAIVQVWQGGRAVQRLR
jgi:imidazolonepropionase-like amidohydrolase